jgi:hypothetical protein
MKVLPGSVPKIEETVGPVYMREETTSRVMEADKTYGKIYDFKVSVRSILDTPS